MREISVEEFDARFDELMELVEAGEPFAIARDGRAVAVLRRMEPSMESDALSDS